MKVTETKKAPSAIGPYSQAISVGNFLFTSGQIPLDPESGAVVEGNIGSQAEQVMKNIGGILEENGIGFEQVIKTSCYLSVMSDFSVFNQVYEKYFISKPARSCVAVKELPQNVLCEVEVVASLSE